jgi:hypothetical protein
MLARSRALDASDRSIAVSMLTSDNGGVNKTEKDPGL